MQRLAAAAALLLFLAVAGLVTGFRVPLRTYDFPLAVYYPARAFLEGVNPYNRTEYLASYPVAEPLAPYLPGTLLLHLPFGLFSPQTSEALYLGFTIALTLILGFVVLRFNGVKPTRAAILLIAGLILLSRPGRQNLRLGQVTLEVVLASYVALYFARRASWIGGLGLAIATFKPSYGFPLALLMLARGDARAVVRGGVLTLLLNLPVLAVLARRAGGMLPATQQVVGTLATFQSRVPANDPLLSPYRIDLTSLLSRLTGLSLGAGLQVLAALAVLGVAALALRSLARRAPSAPFGFVAGIIASAVLLSVYHQPHDLLFLALPFVGMAYHGLPVTPNAPRARLLVLGLFTLLAANYAVSAAAFVRLGIIPTRAGPVLNRAPWAMALVSLNAVALLALFCVYVAVALRGQPRTNRTPASTPRFPA